MDHSDILERIFSILSKGITLTLLICTIVIVAILNSNNSKGKLPPGPWGYPIVGHLPQLGKDPLVTLAKFRQAYGDVYRIRFGKWPALVINGKDAIKMALKGDAFNDRPEFTSIKLVRDMKGITFSHFNAGYIINRKIDTSALKMFTGSRNEAYKEIIEREAYHLVEELLKYDGKTFDPNESLYFAAGSVIFQILYGKGRDLRNDADFSWLVQNTKKFTDFIKAGNPFDALPWMRFVLPKKYNSFCEILKNSREARNKKLRVIRQTYDGQTMRHACDALIMSTNELDNEEKLKNGLTDDLILETAGDFIGAGFDTTATTLRWGFLLLASYPIVQNKIHNEMDDMLDPSQRPCLDDRSRLPFTEATVLEILRYGSTVPLSLPHNALEDTEFLGYVIPKNTVVFLNLYSSNFDKNIWDDPHEFKPERFLDKDGNIVRERADNILTFGVGRRRCIGEQLARMNIFMLLSHLLQRCKIIKPPGEEYNLKGKFTLTNAPEAFRVQVVARR